MADKNIAGMSISLTIIFFALYGSRSTRLPRFAVAAVAATFLYYTSSSTSTIGAAVSLTLGGALLYALPRAPRAYQLQAFEENAKRALFIAWICLAVGLVVVVLNGTWLIDLTRDPKLLTGRTQIWQPMIFALLKSPFMGSGYGAFWEEGAAVAAAKIGPSDGVTQGHNGYLDLAVQIGLPGLLLAVGAMIIWPMLLIIRLRSRAVQLCSLATAVLTFFAINNVTESSIFDGDQILQVFAILIIASLITALRRLDPATRINRQTGILSSSTSAFATQLPVKSETSLASTQRAKTEKRRRRTSVSSTD